MRIAPVVKLAFAVALTACGRIGFDGIGGVVVGPDGNSALPHMTIANGWTVEVFNDFSSRFTFRAQDFVDPPDTYDNAPFSMFLLHAPFSPGLAVVAGRMLIEVSANRYVEHDYGQHPPNTAGQPDQLAARNPSSTFSRATARSTSIACSCSPARSARRCTVALCGSARS